MSKKKMLKRRIQMQAMLVQHIQDRGPHTELLQGELRRPVRPQTKAIAREYLAARYKDHQVEVQIAQVKLQKLQRKWKKKYG